jgi:hypothetical protein
MAVQRAKAAAKATHRRREDDITHLLDITLNNLTAKASKSNRHHEVNGRMEPFTAAEESAENSREADRNITSLRVLCAASVERRAGTPQGFSILVVSHR